MNAHLTPVAYLVSEAHRKQMLAEAERDRLIQQHTRQPARQHTRGISAVRYSLASGLIRLGERLQGVQVDAEGSPATAK